MAATPLERQETQAEMPSGQTRRKMSVRRSIGSAYVWRFVLLAAILITWQFSSGRVVDEIFVSRPTDIAVRLWELFNTGEIWPNLWRTYAAVLIGYSAAVLTGIMVGVLLGRSAFLSAILDPFIMGIYSVPKVALAPLFVLWLGIGLTPKIALAFISAFFLVFFNTFAGMRSVNEEHVSLARIMGASSFDVQRLIILPSTMPYIMVGLKTGLPFAVIGAVVGEFMASDVGLGYYILYSGNTLDSAGVFAGLVVLVGGVAFGNMLLARLEKRVIRWHPTQLANASSRR